LKHPQIPPALHSPMGFATALIITIGDSRVES